MLMLILKQPVLLFANCKDADVIITNWAMVRLDSQLDNLSYS